MDFDKLQKEYTETQKTLAKLDEQMKEARAEKFKALPGTLGLKSIDSLIRELRSYASPLMKAKLNKAFAEDGNGSDSKPAKTRKRRRHRITDDDRKKIVDALKAGGKKAAELASEFGVSVPTINNIKAEAGLTKKRK